MKELTFVKMHLHKRRRHTTNSLETELKRVFKSPANFTEMLNMLPFMYYVDVVSKCGQDVFADTLSNVNKVRSNLLIKRIRKSHISQSKVA